MNELFLSDAEISELCAPLAQAAAQIRYLRGLGLNVTVKPNGRPAVVRSHVEAVLSGRPGPSAPPAGAKPTHATTVPRPNIDGFMKVIQKSKKHGPQKKLQPA